MYQADQDPLTARAGGHRQARIPGRGQRARPARGRAAGGARPHGLAMDTIVLFTADHGEMLGERGLWYKMSFFDGSARVPLIAAGPGIRPGRIEAPVSHLDLAPTIAALAGVEPAAAEFSGVSLAAALTRGDEPPGEAAAEYLAEGGDGAGADAAQGPFQVHPLRRRPRAAVRPGRRIHWSCTIWRRRTHRRPRLRSCATRPTGAGMRPPSTQQVRASQRRRRLVQRALATGAYTPWDHRPQRDASLEYVRGEASAHPATGAATPARGTARIGRRADGERETGNVGDHAADRRVAQHARPAHRARSPSTPPAAPDPAPLIATHR